MQSVPIDNRYRVTILCLRTRDQHGRAHDVATRRAQVGAAQELAERQQLATMAQQIQERA